MSGEIGSISVLDRLELQELVARYALAVDDCDLDRLMGCFAKDVTFVRQGQELRGAEVVREFFAGSMERYDMTLHVPQSQVLQPVDDATVDAWATGSAELVLAGRLILAAYRYRDRYVREDGRWVIERREIQFRYVLPIEDRAAGFTSRNWVRWPGLDPRPSDVISDNDPIDIHDHNS